MAYYLRSFAGQLLPRGDSVDGLSAGPIEQTLVGVAGGAVLDVWGDVPKPLGLHQIAHRGKYSASVDTNLNALMGLIGRRGTLVRRRQLDSSDQQKTARLLVVDWDRGVEQSIHAELRCTFEARGYWRSSSQSTTNRTSTGTMTATNGGTAPIFDPTFTFASSATGSKTIRVQIVALGVDWTWAGTVTNGQSLVIDCGAESILNNGVDAYSGLTLNVAHVSNWWAYLMPGSNSVAVTLTGAGTLTLGWYNQWA